MPAWVITRPIPGELALDTIDLAAPAGQAAHITTWARSIAAHRFLADAPAQHHDR